MRLRALTVVVTFIMVATAVAADQVVVEDWKDKVGATGVPHGWQRQNWGTPKYEFKVVESDGRPALHMKSAAEGSTITRDVKGKMQLKATPILEWSWKAVTLPKGGDSCKKATDDQAAQVFVVWPRFPEAVRSRIIGYVWDSTLPAGTICKSEKTGTVTYIVVHSGPADLGKWITERRNVRDDFQKIYREAPEDPAALSLGIDSNDTDSTAESYIGPIVLKAQ
jgi:hypothetical protein